MVHQAASGSSLAIYLPCINNGQVQKKLTAHKNIERQKAGI